MLLERKTRVIDENCHSRCSEPFLNASVCLGLHGWFSSDLLLLEMILVLSFLLLKLNWKICKKIIRLLIFYFRHERKENCVGKVLKKIKGENIYPIFSFLSSDITKYKKWNYFRIWINFPNGIFYQLNSNYNYLQKELAARKSRRKKGFAKLDFKSRTCFHRKVQGTATMSLRILGSSNVKLWLGLLIVPCWPFWVVARGQTRFPPPFCCFNSIPSAGDDLPITSRDVWKPGVFGPANRNDFPVSL